LGDVDQAEVVRASVVPDLGEGPADVDAESSGEHAFACSITMRLLSASLSCSSTVIRACRKGGVVSVLGVYGGFLDGFPLGAAMNKGLTLRLGQQHGHRRLVHPPDAESDDADEGERAAAEPHDNAGEASCWSPVAAQ
jgi:threonine dehydrogenase-like Zn-dependent dehydrogenase